MHPIDLRRQINPLTAKPTFSMADFFPSPRYRFEILMQVAIEWLLDGDDVKTRLSGNSHYRQVVYDALYYVARLWEDAGSDKPQVPGFKDFKTNPNERKPGLVLDDKYFAEYLESRIAAEHPLGPIPPAKKATRGKHVEQTSGKDFEFLIGKVRELLRFLCHPEDLISEINRSQRTTKPPDFILNEIPKNKALRLIIQEDGKPNYRWLYDASGTYLHTREVFSITEDVGDAIAYIREFMAALNGLGIPGDLVTIADAKIIPRPSELKMVVLPALDQLDRLSADGNAYGNMIADRDAVKEFEDTLEEFEPNIKAALLSAALFAPEVSLSAPSPGAKLTAAIQHIATTLQLSAIAEEDLRKLQSLLASAPEPVANYDQALDLVIASVSQMLKANKVSDETAKNIVVEAWNLTKERFSKHFQEGLSSFDPDYLDVFTALRRTGPGYELASDFSTITARAWSKLLLRSLSGKDLPPWLAVAAALELGMFELAARLATANATDPLTSQWVFDQQRRVPADPTRHNALVLALDSDSLTESWQPSVKNGALIFTAKELAELMAGLAPLRVVNPPDYPIHLIAIELRGNLPTLRRIALNPATAVATMSKITPRKDFETFLNSTRVSYFAAEQFTPTGVLEALLVSAPKTIDELIDPSFSSPSTANPS
jgi:hypothetical protein